MDTKLLSFLKRNYKYDEKLIDLIKRTNLQLLI